MSYVLENVFASLPKTARGSFSIISSDPKGKNFLYVNGNSVFIRNIENPFECDVYTEHSCPVQVAKYSPSGFYIASADQSGKIRIWDTTNKDHILKNEFQPLSGCIKDLQWSSDNQRIIVGGEGREKFGHVFSADTGTSVGEIMGTSKPINSVDFKPTRPFRAVVASEDSNICYFEGPPFKWNKTLSEHTRFVNVIRYSPNGEKFASGGADGKLVIFDGKTGEKLGEINAHNGSILSLSWNPSSSLILTASGDKTAKIWNVDEKTLVKEFKFGDSIDDQQMACLWQNLHLLTVSLSGQINYLDANPGSSETVLRSIKGHNKSVTALETIKKADASAFVISGSHDGVIVCWNSSNGQMNVIKASNGSSVGQHKNQVQALRYDASTGLVISCGLDDTLKYIDINEYTYVHDIKLDSQPQGLDVSSNGSIVVACINHLILVRNKQVFKKVKLAYEATCVSVQRTKNQVAVGGKDNKVHIYDLDSLNEVHTLQERDFITAIRYSNDDDYLAVADNVKNIKCYKIDSTTSYNDITRDMWQHHAGKITSLSWSADSSMLASSSVDTHCFIYSPSKKNQYIHIKNAHPLNPLTGCAWIDNSHLITSSQDCCLRKWRITPNF